MSTVKPVIRVILNNRYTQFQVSPETQIKLKDYFKFRPDGYEFSEKYRSGAWDGFVNMLQRGRVSTGLFLEKKTELEKDYKLSISDKRVFPKFYLCKSTSKLRPYQLTAVASMMGSSGGLILAATGSGKTRVIAALFDHLEGYGLFIVDELSLMTQTHKEMSNFIPEKIGIVGKSIFDPQRITVATIQTLQKHRDKKIFKDWLNKIDVLVIDEIHLAVNKRSIEIVHQIKPKAVFGLTATLELEKDYIRYPAVALAGPVIFSYPIQEGVEQGYLSRGAIADVLFGDPLQGRSPGYWTIMKKKRVWIPSGSPFAEYRYHITLNKSRNDCIEEIVREGLGRNHRIVVLVERKVHLRVLANRFKDLNYEALSGDDESSVRTEAMKAMDEGRLPLILASRIFSKGVNIRSVDVIIDGTALPGRNSAMQRYGRGSRKTEGKRGIRYINIADRGNPFEGTAHSRLKALREVGAPITEFIWESGEASKIYESLEKTLMRKPDAD